MKRVINKALLTSTILMLAPQAIAEVQTRIGGNGVNNPTVDMVAFDNVVKLYFGNSTCTGTLIAGKWLLTTKHCSHHDGVSKTSLTTAWKPSFDASYSPTASYAVPSKMVVHPEYDEGAESVLMEIESYPNYAKFNPINPAKMTMIAWEDFCMRSGLNKSFTNENCEWSTNPETGISEPTIVTGNYGQELFIYGYAGTHTLRRGRIEAVSDFGRNDESVLVGFMGAYADGFKGFDEDGIDTEGGDSGAPYLDKEGAIRGVNYGLSPVSEMKTTHADQLSYKPEWILNTINGWNYPTQVTTENNSAIVYFQSLHINGIDLLNTLSTDGVEIVEDSLFCKTPQNQSSTLLVEPWDICQMTITNTSGSEGKVYLSSDNVITVDYGRKATEPEVPTESDGGSMGWSLSALGLLMIIRRKNLSIPKMQ